MEVKQSDSLEFLKNQADYENDIIFADPPYALGSEVIIRADGKVDYAKATDFMNKWEMPTGDVYNEYKQDNAHFEEVEGRYPAQTFVDSQVAEKLDLQSGVSSGGTIISNVDVNRKGLKADAPAFNSKNSGIDVNKGQGLSNYGDIGGCSKILHKCDYEQIDFDLFIYEPKVDSGERNNGLDEFEDKIKHWHDMENANKNQDNPKNYLGGKITHQIVKNNHPTLKPIDLNCKILKLFKTPNEQRICYPFAGSGSEIIGGLKADFQNWTACEINQEYVDIANARIKHYKENEYVQLDLFGGE